MAFKVGDTVKVTAEGALGYGISGKIRGAIEEQGERLYVVSIDEGTSQYPHGYIVQSEENLAPLKTLADSRWEAERNSPYYTVSNSGRVAVFAGNDPDIHNPLFDSYNMWQSRRYADIVARKTKLLWLIGQLNIAAGGDFPADESNEVDTWQVGYNHSANVFCLVNIDNGSFYPSGIVIQGRQRARRVVTELNRLKDNGELDWYFQEDEP